MHYACPGVFPRQHQLKARNGGPGALGGAVMTALEALQIGLGTTATTKYYIREATHHVASSVGVGICATHEPKL